jgi:hypothetical protein
MTRGHAALAAADAPALAVRLPGVAAALRLATDVAPMVALYVGIERALAVSCRLPEAAYTGPVIAAGLLRRVAGQPLALVAVAALVALGLWRREPVLRAWSELEHGRALRWLVSGIALFFAWAFSSYDTNLYFDRAHLADRALLLALAACVVWRPVFVAAFLPLLVAMVWQFEYPLGGYSWTDKSAPFRALVFFLAGFLWLAVRGERRTGALLFGIGALVAGHYWVPGLEKLRLGWLAHGHLHHLTLAAWENGWLVSLDADRIAALVRALAWFDPWLQAFTLVAEAGALFFFWRREVALGLLAAWALLHAGIFVTSGICFWKWMLLDAALFAVIWRLPRESAQRIFGPGPLLVSLPLVLFAWSWCAPVRLGWYDTRLAYTYRYEATGVSGARYRLAASFFAPFDLQFAQNRFDYLTRTPALVSTYGNTQDAGIANALLAARDADTVFALEARMGRVLYDERRSARLDAFLVRYLSAWNRRGMERQWYAALGAPLHIRTAPREPAYRGQEPIARLAIERVTTLWNGERLEEIRVERVRELAIDAGSAARAGDVAGGGGVRAQRAIEPEEQRREQQGDAERGQPHDRVAQEAAARQTDQRHKAGDQRAVAANDADLLEAAQQVPQAVLGEAVEVVRRLVDLEQERRAEEHAPAGGEHAVDLGERGVRSGDVLEHLEQQHRVEAGVGEAAEVLDVGHHVGRARGIHVHVDDAGVAEARHARGQGTAGADVQHARLAGLRVERGQLALEPLGELRAAEAVRGVDHALRVAEPAHCDRHAPAQAEAHARSPQRRPMLAPRSA